MKKNTKTVALISCSNHYNNRVKFIEEYFNKRDYNTIYIVSDFNHTTKKYCKVTVANIAIHVPKYTKNISIARILSHRVFAKKLYKELININPDIVYSMIPPNYLVKYLAKYKKKYETKLIFDVFDMWPESFTNKSKFLQPFLNKWKTLRNDNLATADAIITECNYFKEILEKDIEVNTDTLYLTKGNTNIEKVPYLEKNIINVCYLGAINNIIDIDKTVAILSKINQKIPVVFYIIGDGEKLQKLLDTCQTNNIKVDLLGKIYDDEKKQKIFNKCDFGINILKEDLVIGLSMKSIDYLEGGLPIITNIEQDLGILLKTYKAGFVINSADEVENTIILDKQLITIMKNSAYKLFVDKFSLERFNKTFDEIFNKIK